MRTWSCLTQLDHYGRAQFHRITDDDAGSVAGDRDDSPGGGAREAGGARAGALRGWVAGFPSPCHMPGFRDQACIRFPMKRVHALSWTRDVDISLNTHLSPYALWNILSDLSSVCFYCNLSSLAIIAVMKMIGVMQVQCCVSSASDQEEHSIPIKAMQYIGQLICCNPNRLPVLLANNRNNLRIIILVMLWVFKGAGINARLLDSYNCDFQFVENYAWHLDCSKPTAQYSHFIWLWKFQSRTTACFACHVRAANLP